MIGYLFFKKKEKKINRNAEYLKNEKTTFNVITLFQNCQQKYFERKMLILSILKLKVEFCIFI